MVFIISKLCFTGMAKVDFVYHKTKTLQWPQSGHQIKWKSLLRTCLTGSGRRCHPAEGERHKKFAHNSHYKSVLIVRFDQGHSLFRVNKKAPHELRAFFSLCALKDVYHIYFSDWVYWSIQLRDEIMRIMSTVVICLNNWWPLNKKYRAGFFPKFSCNLIFFIKIRFSFLL